MPGINDKQDAQVTDVDRVRDLRPIELDHAQLERFVYEVFQDGRLNELLEIAFEGVGGCGSSDLGAKPFSGIQAAIEAYHNWKESQGGDMDTDVQPSRKGRPQTIPRAYAGKWIAWSEDGMRIVAIGESFDDCERAAVEAGFSPNHVGIDHVPVGRHRLDG